MRAPLLRLSTDDALARRAARGDDEAFSALYGRYQPRLEAYCRAILRHDEDARDAAQSSLAKAFLALQRGEEPERVRAWLFRIAHNEAIDVVRRRRPTEELRDTVPGAGQGPADMAEQREELRAVLEAVHDLPTQARQALLLRELAGLDYPAVAMELGTTAGGARQAVFEARTALHADRAGRREDCATIRQQLSERDDRRRPTRQVRGHLRGCDACRAWSSAQRHRRQRLAIGVPVVGSLWGWLAATLGGGAAGGTATITGGFALQTQALATAAVLAVGITPVATETMRSERGGDGAAGSPAVARADAGGSEAGGGAGVVVAAAAAAAAPTQPGTPGPASLVGVRTATSTTEDRGAARDPERTSRADAGGAREADAPADDLDAYGESDDRRAYGDSDNRRAYGEDAEGDWWGRRTGERDRGDRRGRAPVPSERGSDARRDDGVDEDHGLDRGDGFDGEAADDPEAHETAATPEPAPAPAPIGGPEDPVSAPAASPPPGDPAPEQPPGDDTVAPVPEEPA